MNIRRISSCVVVFAAMVAVGSAHAVCTNASLVGTFGFLYTSSDGAGNQDTSVGQIVFDGAGNLTGTETRSSNGTIIPGAIAGTYSVAKACTGTLFLPDPKHPLHFNFVIDNGKKGAQFIEADDVFGVRAGFFLGQGTVTCGLTGKKQTLALNLTGTGVGVGPVAAVSQITLSGTGTLFGTTTFNQNGTVVSASLNGSYTENSDCTGSAQVMVSGQPTSNYNFVVVNAGRELLLIETDTGTIVSGTMQQ